MKRKVFTITIVAIAIALVIIKYNHYIVNPWTRDGLVRAHIIEITPRATGPIIRVHVTDNQAVQQGELLFEIDSKTYDTELEKAQANVQQMETVLAKAVNEQSRGFNLERHTPGSISTLSLNNLTNAVESAKANVRAAKASLQQAQLNVEFTKVYAPVSGYITNLRLSVGTNVVANQPLFALIDTNSYWIEGYFKETDINQIQPGAKAIITLMSYPNTPLNGEVVTVGYGIAQDDGSTGNYQLPNVNPNFQWIRLAQRLPVKVKVNALPDDVTLRVGTTVSILIKPIKSTQK